MIRKARPLLDLHTSRSSIARRAGVAGSMGGVVVLALFVTLLLASTAQAATPSVSLGTSGGFAILAGSTITNTGPSIINGNLGLHPGSSVTGFPPGTVNGVQHVSDAVALKAKDDLTNAYKDAAGRANTATLSSDVGGRTLRSGVYRTGSVASLQLTGNLTLDAQGNPSSVFIFQIESTLTTASGSSVTLANGAQACNVFWQVGSSATLGTTTAFKGNILALTSISVNNGATVDGSLLARNGAVTLINDTVTRSQCVAGTSTATSSPGPDLTKPRVQVSGLNPSVDLSGRPSADCTTSNFTLRIKARDIAGIHLMKIYLDNRVVKRVTSTTQASVRINVTGLRVGKHTIKVLVVDRAGNRTIARRTFDRCELGVAVPAFTG